MSIAIAAAVFPVIFLGELPDKTMFASLVLASRGKPIAVWLGAAAAFAVHVAIAVSVGVAIFDLLPHRVVDVIVAVLFVAGAVYSYHARNEGEGTAGVTAPASPRRTALTAALVIFGAEWGDLTQILTANLAAHYHRPLSVGVGAVLALWAVAGIAVVSGSSLTRVLSVRVLRIVTAAVLLVLAGYSASVAAR